MAKLFQLRRDQLRYAALARVEKHLGFAIKYGLLPVALLVTGIIRPDSVRHPLFYVYLGVFVSGTLTYAYLYGHLSGRRLRGKTRNQMKRKLTHHTAIITFSSCLEVFCISFIYYMLVGDRPVPIIFFLLSLPVLRLILLYPTVPEFILAVGSSSLVFLFVTATLGTRQLLLPSFWIYFASMWLIFGLGIAIVDKLFTQFNQSAKGRQLILQALQMVSSLVEMAESTAHLHEKSKIFQRSVEIVSRVMAVHSCVAWVYEASLGTLCPVAAAGLDAEEADRFNQMELLIQDIPIFDRALTQKVPIVADLGRGDVGSPTARKNKESDVGSPTARKKDAEKGRHGESPLKAKPSVPEVPLFYRRCFRVNTILVIPLTDNERTLGCVALHWRIAPEKITSQDLAIISGIATQIGITLENVYLLEELREKEEVRGRLLERVISIQEGERERIARELHDETGQILTALMMNVELLRTEPEFQSAKSQKRLEETSLLLSRTMEDIHNLSLDLHPKILNELGLVPAIRWYMKNHLERWGINFDIAAGNLDHCLSAKQEICLFRVTQEAITNVVRHAQARRVDVDISVDAECVYLSICDDGKGFQVDPHRGGERLGLRSMEERVSFLDGQIDIRSDPGKGTQVSVNIPLRTGRDS